MVRLRRSARPPSYAAPSRPGSRTVLPAPGVIAPASAAAPAPVLASAYAAAPAFAVAPLPTTPSSVLGPVAAAASTRAAPTTLPVPAALAVGLPVALPTAQGGWGATPPAGALATVAQTPSATPPRPATPPPAAAAAWTVTVGFGDGTTSEFAADGEIIRRVVALLGEPRAA